MPLICDQIFNEACILANGDVVCSCIDSQGCNILGNINQNGIYEIFHGIKYENLRQKINNSKLDSYCPILNFNCVYKRSNFKNFDNPFKIETLRLETTAYCNLKCPGCPSRCWMDSENSIKSHPRLGYIPIDKIERVFTDTKDTLKTILLYNFGEPFLDKRLLEILRLAKRIVPGVFILVSTNGTVMPVGWPEIIIQEGLIDRIIFSIDGASQESYGKYRVGGNFDKAFRNMAEFSKYLKLYAKSIPQLEWQYILFKWNDSDEEIKHARELAVAHGLTLHWLYTHTEGNSQRCLPKLEEDNELKEMTEYSCGIVEPGHGVRSIKSGKKFLEKPTWAGLVVGFNQYIFPKIKCYCLPIFRLGGGLGNNDLGMHVAKIEIKKLSNHLMRDERIYGNLMLHNLGQYTWQNSEKDMTRLGVQLLDKNGTLIDLDFRRVDLLMPLPPGESEEMDFVIAGVHRSGEYILRFDMVRENICWFSQKANHYYVDKQIKVN
jgi:pyruvate-formate lyase-activating enzyme